MRTRVRVINNYDSKNLKIGDVGFIDGYVNASSEYSDGEPLAVFFCDRGPIELRDVRQLEYIGNDTNPSTDQIAARDDDRDAYDVLEDAYIECLDKIDAEREKFFSFAQEKLGEIK